MLAVIINGSGDGGFRVLQLTNKQQQKKRINEIDRKQYTLEYTKHIHRFLNYIRCTFDPCRIH